VHQVHSPDVHVATGTTAPSGQSRRDGHRTPGLVIGVLTADCGPVLFADAQAGVIGAAHAGWRGAFDGVLESTIEAMQALGAKSGRIIAVLGPSISQANYEVGPEFVDRFLARDAAHDDLFQGLGETRTRLVRPQAVTLDRLARKAGLEPPTWSPIAPMPTRRPGIPTAAPPTATNPITDDRSPPSPSRRTPMALHFEREEYAARLSKLTASMGEEKLDAILLFAQESMYWLTGYDTFGFCFFQCLVVKADGNMTLLTRSADLRQARQTSNIERIMVWTDRTNADPALDLKNLLSDLDLLGARIGVEYDTHGLTGANCHKLDNQLQSFAELVDASYVVSRLRLIKSPAEIVYARRAAELADAALDAAMPLIKPGGSEADILASPCRARCSPAAETIPPTSSSSAPAKTRSYAATSQDAASLRQTTSSRSNGPASLHITMPR
jgi:hypothetical protein